MEVGFLDPGWWALFLFSLLLNFEPIFFLPSQYESTCDTSHILENPPSSSCPSFSSSVCSVSSSCLPCISVSLVHNLCSWTRPGLSDNEQPWSIEPGGGWSNCKRARGWDPGERMLCAGRQLPWKRVWTSGEVVRLPWVHLLPRVDFAV